MEGSYSRYLSGMPVISHASIPLPPILAMLVLEVPSALVSGYIVEIHPLQVTPPPPKKNLQSKLNAKEGPYLAN
jgi:hypothetical protein